MLCSYQTCEVQRYFKGGPSSRCLFFHTGLLLRFAYLVLDCVVLVVVLGQHAALLVVGGHLHVGTALPAAAAAHPARIVENIATWP